jgi:hypothetical protein
MPTRTETTGDNKVTASYDVDTSGMGYSIITPDIAADFDFLTGDLPNKLDEVAGFIQDAAGISDAFYFENGDTVQDISEAAEKLTNDINNLKGTLSTLHSAFMTDIDQINAELEYNYGWVTVVKPKGSYKVDKIEE